MFRKSIRLAALLVVLSMVTSYPAQAMGIMPIMEDIQKGYSLTVNGETLVFDGYTPEPYMKGDVLMLPLRSIMENIGFEVEWQAETKSIQLSKGTLKTEISLNQAEYVDFEGKSVDISVAPELSGYRTFIPIDFYTSIIGLVSNVEGQSIGLTGQLDRIIDVKDSGIIPIVVDVPVDYMVENFYEYDHSVVESPISGEENAIRIMGNNHSDDMFMGFYKQLTNLEPDTEYIFKLGFDLGTNVPKSMMGIGGSPGSSVYVKAGLTEKKPMIVVENGQYLMESVDKGNQSRGGQDLRMIGNMEKESEDMSESFEYKNFTTYHIGRTDSEGKIHLVIGTDSGFEGLTEVYYDNIVLTVREATEYNRSTLKEKEFQLESAYMETENGSFVSLPEATGMIQGEIQEELNAILSDTVESLLEGRSVSSFYFSYDLKDTGVLSVVFLGERILVMSS